MRIFVAVLGLLVSVEASAALYEIPINDVDDEDDLIAMEARGDISEATLETLRELITTAVDLNSGSPNELYDLPGLTQVEVDAIVAYRKANGRIEDPAELVTARAITPAQLLQIAPFIRIDPAALKLPVSGKFRLVGSLASADNLAPPGVLTARLKGPLGLSAGVMLIGTRQQPGVPEYDDLRFGALRADAASYRVNVPRSFLQWRSGVARVVVGTFHLGFAERLTLDNSRRYTPNGLYLTEDFRRPPDLSSSCRLSGAETGPGCLPPDPNNPSSKRYVSPDFDWREAFRGVAGSIEDLSLGNGWEMSLYGFLSYQSRQLYQYELFNKGACDDPRSTSSACGAPDVYVKSANPTLDTRLIFSTLPGLFDELAGGARAQFKPAPGFSFGVTAYGANPYFRQAGAPAFQLDFQEWSRYPFGGAYGAVGVDGSARFGEFALSFEATKNFNSIPGANGGGYAAIQRTVWSRKRHEVELSFRFYDLNFANPYARPISAPDEFQGQRARNEAGARVTYTGRFGADWAVRARANFWLLPYTTTEGPAGTSNLWLLARVEFNGLWWFQPAIWVDLRNKNLASNVRGRCSSDYNFDPDFNPTLPGDTTNQFTCSGDFYRVAGRIEFRPLKSRLLSGAVQVWTTWLDDIRYKDRFRQDVQGFVELRSMPADWLLLRLRSRYLFQDISDNAYLEQSLWSFLQVSVIPTRNLNIGLRYDLYLWLDRRESTGNRVPVPEHRVLVDLRAGF